MAEGLSTGIGQGYAQVLQPSAPADIFGKLTDVLAADKKLKDEEAKAKKKAADKNAALLERDVDKLPSKWYGGHDAEIKKDLSDFISYVNENQPEIGTPEYIQYQEKLAALKTKAELSYNYREQLEQIKKGYKPENYSDGSQAYYDQLLKGYDENGNMLTQVDATKFVARPDYTKFQTAFEKNAQPEKFDEGDAALTASGQPGIYQARQKKGLSLTPERIEEVKEELWAATDGAPRRAIEIDYMEKLAKGDAEAKKYESLAQPDPNTGAMNYQPAVQAYFKDHFKKAPIDKKWTSTKYVTDPTIRSQRGAGVYESYDPEYVTTDVSEVVRPSEAFYNTLTTKNPNLKSIKKGSFKYVNYSLSGAVKDPFAESKDEKGNPTNKLIVDENSGKYYDFAGNDVTDKVENLQDKSDIELDDVVTPSVEVDSYLPNIQKTSVIKVDPRAVQLTGKVTKDGVQSDEVVSFTTDEMEIVDDKRGAYLKAFEVDNNKKPTGRIINIPYTEKVDEIIAGKINFVSKGKDKWETPKFVKFGGAKKQSTQSSPGKTESTAKPKKPKAKASSYGL